MRKRVEVEFCPAEAQQLLDHMWNAGMRPTAHVEARSTAEVNGRPLSDYLSTIECSDYDTSIGHLAKVNPEALSLIRDLCEETKQDGWWLCHAARKASVAPIEVPAPKVLRELGIETVKAYPVELLKRRFGG